MTLIEEMVLFFALVIYLGFRSAYRADKKKPRDYRG
jgi:cbb3-type cytochrome oxidase subunit 3